MLGTSKWLSKVQFCEDINAELAKKWAERVIKWPTHTYVCFFTHQTTYSKFCDKVSKMSDGSQLNASDMVAIDVHLFSDREFDSFFSCLWDIHCFWQVAVEKRKVSVSFFLRTYVLSLVEGSVWLRTLLMDTNLCRSRFL